MASCTIYYPGLLGPDVNLNDLDSSEWPESDQYNSLCKLLSHGKRQPLPRKGLEARILECLGIESQHNDHLPISYFRVTDNSLANENLWCLDPVCVQIDRDQAILAANESLNLSQSEALEIIDDLNSHFFQDGLQVHYHSEHQWLLSGELDLVTAGMSDAMYQNIHEFQPKGKDESRWRSIITEVQMLLHLHPVNQKRMEKGELTVNSLWIWGKGKPLKIDKQVNIVFSNDTFSKCVANTLNIKHMALAGSMDERDVKNNDSLFIYTEQLKAVKSNDVFSWFDWLRLFDSTVLRSLLDMLQRGEIDEINLKSDTFAVSVVMKDLKKPFWRIFRRTESFKKNISDLRDQYGY